MNKSSALIIAVAIIVGCVILGVFLREPPHDVRVQAQGDKRHLSMQGGRYQIVSHGEKMLLLDSRTGRCWQKVLSRRAEGTVNWCEQSPDFAKTSKQK